MDNIPFTGPKRSKEPAPDCGPNLAQSEKVDSIRESQEEKKAETHGGSAKRNRQRANKRGHDAEAEETEVPGTGTKTDTKVESARKSNRRAQSADDAQRAYAKRHGDESRGTQAGHNPQGKATLIPLFSRLLIPGSPQWGQETRHLEPTLEGAALDEASRRRERGRVPLLPRKAAGGQERRGARLGGSRAFF